MLFKLSYKIWCIIITVFAAILRIANLGHPRTLVFDETYYVKDAWSLLSTGVERVYPNEKDPSTEDNLTDAAFALGDVNTFSDEASYVVHPPIGRWIIGFGMKISELFGLSVTETAFAWRLGNAIVGVLAVILVILCAKKLFGEKISLIAGVLFAVDGLAIIHSRTGLLDQFVMIFVLLAFWCLLNDLEEVKIMGRRVSFLNLILCAISLGLATSVKWSGLYFCLVFGIIAIWGSGADDFFRDVPGKVKSSIDKIVDCCITSCEVFVFMFIPAVFTYLFSWISWFSHPDAYGRSGSFNIITVINEFVDYHVKMLDFHVSLDSEHSYQSNPWGWLLQIRPTSFFYESTANSCGSQKCSSAITSLGNPLIWWLGTLCILVVVGFIVVKQDKKAILSFSGILAGWVPWVLLYSHRTIFTFYAIAFEPWLIFSICFAIYQLRKYIHLPENVKLFKISVGVSVVLLVLVSAFFYPIWTAWEIPYNFWRAHMWLSSWV